MNKQDVFTKEEVLHEYYIKWKGEQIHVYLPMSIKKEKQCVFLPCYCILYLMFYPIFVCIYVALYLYFL